MKIVTPYGEIPWQDLSRISDEEMKRLMKEVVNNIYTFLCRQEDTAFLEALVMRGGMYAAKWDEPEMRKDFVVPEGHIEKNHSPAKVVQGRSRNITRRSLLTVDTAGTLPRFAEELVEELVGFELALLRDDNRFGHASGISDVALPVKTVHRSPVMAFPGRGFRCRRRA